MNSTDGSYSRGEILRQLDQCAEQFTFPMLDNGYVYLGTARLTAYRDAQRWALIIEVVGQSPRGGGHSGLTNALHCFGNCLKRPPGTANEDFLQVTRDGPEGRTFGEGGCDWRVLPDAKSIRIRDELISLDLSPETLQAKGIELAEPPDLTAADLMRSLLPDYRDLLLATEAELRQRVPPDLPQFLRLEEWRHPDLADGELPSQSPTFQMIADALVSGEPDGYQPAAAPNTHWRFWPDGGTL